MKTIPIMIFDILMWACDKTGAMTFAICGWIKKMYNEVHKS